MTEVTGSIDRDASHLLHESQDVRGLSLLLENDPKIHLGSYLSNGKERSRTKIQSGLTAIEEEAKILLMSQAGSPSADEVRKRLAGKRSEDKKKLLKEIGDAYQASISMNYRLEQQRLAHEETSAVKNVQNRSLVHSHGVNSPNKSGLFDSFENRRSSGAKPEEVTVDLSLRKQRELEIMESPLKIFSIEKGGDKIIDNHGDREDIRFRFQPEQEPSKFGSEQSPDIQQHKTFYSLKLMQSVPKQDFVEF